MRKMTFSIMLIVMLLAIVLLSCHREEEKYAQKLLQTLDKGKVIRTRNVMDRISYCLNRYMMDHGSYPEANEVSAVITEMVPQYANDLPHVDAWKNELSYSSDGEQYTLTSAGDDEIFDTEDDITMQNGVYH